MTDNASIAQIPLVKQTDKKELNDVKQEYRQAVAETEAIIIDVVKINGIAEITLSDPLGKFTKKILLDPKYMNRQAVREEAVYVITQSRKKPVPDKNAAPEANTPCQPVSEDQLKLVKLEFRQIIADAGLIIVEVAHTEQKGLVGVGINDPAGKLKIKYVRLDSDGELDRLNEAISGIKWSLRRDESMAARAVPQVFIDLAKKIGVKIPDHPERISETKFRLNISAEGAAGRTVVFSYDIGQIDGAALEKFEQRAREIAHYSKPAVSGKAVTIIKPQRQPTLEDIKPEYHVLAEKLGVTFQNIELSGGHIRTTVSPKTLTVVQGEQSKTVDGSFAGSLFVFDGKKNEMKRFEEMVVGIIETATRQWQERLENEKRNPTYGKNVPKDKKSPGKSDDGQISESDLRGMLIYHHTEKGYLIVTLNATLDSPAAIQQFEETFAEVIKSAREKIGEIEDKAAARAAAAQSPENTGQPQRIKGLPRIYYAVAQEIGVVINDPKRGTNGKLQSVAVSDDRILVTAGMEPDQKTYAFPGGLYIKEFRFLPKQRFNHPDQIESFRELAQVIATNAKKAREGLVEWSLLHKQTIPAAIEVADTTKATPPASRKSPRRNPPKIQNTATP